MKTFEQSLTETEEIGFIQSINNYLVYISGLPGAKINELVISEKGHLGIIASLLPNLCEAIIFNPQNLEHNLRVARTGELLKIPVGFGFLGRIVNSLGKPLDGAGPIVGEKEYREIDPPPVAGEMLKRSRIRQALETGVMAVDLLVPLGCGQRELIIGDQKVGKTSFLLQTIVSQVRKGALCIYCSIGKKRSDQKSVVDYLSQMRVLPKVVVLAAGSSDPTPMVYLTIFSAFTLAEYFRDSGREVLIILDDLSNHAKFYREIALLSKNPPGRQSYPGDIFYLHSHLLERAGNFGTGNGKTVAITALPVVDTLEGDLTGYIQTNSMAATDGHIFFDLSEFKKGRRPAVNFALSVSRVGNQTLSHLELDLSGKIRDKLVAFRKAAELGHFGLELTQKTKQDMQEGEKIETLLNQESTQVIAKPLQLVFFGLFFTDFWIDKNSALVQIDKIKLITAADKGMLTELAEKIHQMTEPELFYQTIKNHHQKISEVLSYVR